MINRPGDQNGAGSRWALACVAILSLLQYRVTILLHGANFEQLVAATRGLVHGEPHWRGYQNRVLTPFLAAHIDALTGVGLEIVVLLGMMILPFVQNYLVFLLIRRLTGDPGVAFRYTAVFALAFLGLQDANWLYLWDYVDVIVFTAFLYGVLAGRSTLFFVGVFMVGILNRESALLIAVWMLFDGLTTEPEPGKIRPGLRNRGRVAAGLGSLLAGVVIVEGLRRWLFVTSAGTRAGIEQIPLGPIGMTRLNHNLSTIVDSLFAPTIFMPLAITATVVAAAVWVLTRLPHCDRRLLPMALTFLVAWMGNMVFGLIEEARVHLWLMPFIVFLHLGLSGHVREDQDPTEP